MLQLKKIKFFALGLGSILMMGSCTKDEVKTETVTNTVTQFSNSPVEPTTLLKAGTIVNETNPSGTTVGSLCVLKDANGCNFVVLNSDFNSNFGTGTLAVYLAATNENIDVQRGAAGDTTNVNVLAVGFVLGGSKQSFRLPANTGQGTPFDINNYNDVVFYCENASVNFGYAMLN